MATRHEPVPRGASRFERRHADAIVASLLAATFVLALVLSPGGMRAHATNIFGGLREPGEPAFIAAHRGDRSTAPENTLAAFAAAFDRGFDFVECDVRLTADGVAVLLHDETVDRTTNGSGAISELSFAEARELDAGSWYDPAFAEERIPSLGEFLDLLAFSRSTALIELKDDWLPEDLASIHDDIYLRGVQDRVVFASFSLLTIRSLAETEPAIPRVVLQRRLTLDPVALAEAFGAVAIMTNPDALAARPDAAEALYDAGLGLLLYTLNSEERWSEALALGVDGIATDRPGKLGAWIAEIAPGA